MLVVFPLKPALKWILIHHNAFSGSEDYFQLLVLNSVIFLLFWKKHKVSTRLNTHCRKIYFLWKWDLNIALSELYTNRTDARVISFLSLSIFLSRCFKLSSLAFGLDFRGAGTGEARGEGLGEALGDGRGRLTSPPGLTPCRSRSFTCPWALSACRLPGGSSNLTVSISYSTGGAFHINEQFSFLILFLLYFASFFCHSINFKPPKFYLKIASSKC